MSDDEPEIAFADSRFLTYAIPFAGALLIAAGIGAGVVGAYAPLQQEFGLCDEPTIAVYTPERTAELTAEGPSLDRLTMADLTEAERRAVEEALEEPSREGGVDGEFENRAAFERGVLIRDDDGNERYATLTSNNNCVAVDPILFPLGVAAVLLGIVWILAPPMYRKFAIIERRST